MLLVGQASVHYCKHPASYTHIDDAHHLSAREFAGWHVALINIVIIKHPSSVHPKLGVPMCDSKCRNTCECQCT